MSIFPDLAGQNIEFMDFFFHISDGFEWVNDFWKKKSLDTSLHSHSVFFPYVRNKVDHTIVLRWRLAHRNCCDVWLSVECNSHKELKIKTKHRSRQTGFVEFLNIVRKSNKTGRIVARYGFLVSATVLPVMSLPRIKVTGVRLEVEDIDKRSKSKDKTRVEVNYIGEKCLIIVEPSRRLRFLKEPVHSNFFAAPMQIASAFAQALRGVAI